MSHRTPSLTIKKMATNKKPAEVKVALLPVFLLPILGRV
ncbi:hypothetical protein JOE21_001393 [Desmospora profundinema]|uniref:Uncharacterized protein n=1 Tax=Desmospora profundinema TaxID=1571184 RepID=A0ABU1IKU0_9BACL|nr:hypothetical protein [Desmospora profundinema]